MSTPISIPILLGIVGHCNVLMNKYIDQKIRDALSRTYDEFDAAYPSTPKILITALSPGVDQLAADIALNRSQWSVRAPLPFPPNVYLDSAIFQPTSDVAAGMIADGRAKFLELLGHENVDWFVVPVPDRVQLARDRLAEMVKRRPGTCPADEALQAGYLANSGGYIVRHCHCLLACWDGCEEAAPTGATELVRFQLGGLAPAHYPWTDYEPLGFDKDRGPVVAIHTPQAGDYAADAGVRRVLLPSSVDGQYYGVAVDVGQVVRRLSPWTRLLSRVSEAWGESAPRNAPTQRSHQKTARHAAYREYDQFLKVCQAIEDFNREAQAIKPHDATRTPDGTTQTYKQRMQQVQSDVDQHFPAPPANPANPRPSAREWYRRLSQVRETAAHLTGRLTPYHNSAGVVLFGALIAWLATLHFYAHPVIHADHSKPPEHPTGMLVAFVILWPLTGLVVVGVWWLRWDARRLDYRTLSEALRIRREWALVGIERSVADAYLSQTRSEVAWIRRALLHLCPPPALWREHFDGLTFGQKCERLRKVRSRWVLVQEARHRDSAAIQHANVRRCRRRGFVLAVMGWLVLISPLLFQWGQGALTWALASYAPATTAESSAMDQSTDPVTGGASNSVPVGPNDSHRDAIWLDPERPPNTLIVVGSMLLIFGAGYVAVCERRAYEQLGKQYEQIYVVFRAGGRELDTVLDPPQPAIQRAHGSAERLFVSAVSDGSGQRAELTPNAVSEQASIATEKVDVARAQRIIEALGREMLQENAQWLLIRRSKPLELPLGA